MALSLESLDVTEELGELETLLRELVLLELKQSDDEDWNAVHQVPVRTVDRWRGYRNREGETAGGVLGATLIHYASLGELRDLIVEHWSLFGSVFASKEDFEFALDKLIDLRNPDAHRRSLLRWQKHLVFGLAGEIRNQIVKFRSLRLDPLDYRPSLILAHDDDGFYVVPLGKRAKALKRSGETIRLTVKATDPQEYAIEYRFFVYGVNKPGYEARTDWSGIRDFSFKLEDEHVTDNFGIGAECRRITPNVDTNRYDSFVVFNYVVLPAIVSTN